jgi:hypothetical protein
MKSSKKIVSLEKILPYFTIVFPFDIDFSLNRETWHVKKGETRNLTYNQYEVLNHSEYAEELFRHNS